MATRPGVAYLGIYEHRLVDGDGHITQPWYDALQALNARSNSSGDVSAVGDLTLNRLIVGNGGQDIRAEALNDGQIPIGATSDGTVQPATITAGANIAVTNGAHSITIAATGVVIGPAGANTDIQYNDSGSFGGDANLTWDKTTRQARAIGSLASPIRASVGSSGGGEIGLSPFSAAGNDLTLGAYADAAQDWIPSGTDLLDLFQRSSAHQDGGFEVAYGLTAGVPDPFTAAVGVHIVTPTDTSGDPINALEVYQYGGLGTGAKPGLLVIANRNDSGAGAASTLGGEQRSGTRWYIWQDATGAMRYGPARPTEDNSVSDTSGTLFATGQAIMTTNVFSRRSESTARVVMVGSQASSPSAASGNWVPLALGTEPLQFVSDGAGNPVFTWFAP